MTHQEAATLAYQEMLAIPRDDQGNPLTLAGAIRSMILKSPHMIPYRDDALGIMYCTLGAGIRWSRGRLGDVSPNNYMNLPPQPGGQGIWSRSSGFEDAQKRMAMPDEIKQVIQQLHQAEVAAAIQTVQDIDRRCQEYGPTQPSWYPISWYACNLCAPPDAQEDFLFGAVETATLITSARPTPGTQRWIVHQQTKQYAQEMLLVLQSRVGRIVADAPLLNGATPDAS